MQKVLITGSTGFIGRNIIPIMEQTGKYELICPTRKELDLKNELAIKEYLNSEKFDVVLHLANPSPAKNPLDNPADMTEDSLRIFMNFYEHRDLYSKLIYIGSGAEYDKSQDINMVSESECYRSVPKDGYGLCKVIMNSLAEQSENIYNLRIFGCYGPTDHESKFITHCIRSVLFNKDVTIRRDCEFDYLHVNDLATYIMWAIDNEMSSHSYNVCTGHPILLTDIAKIIVKKMNSDLSVKLLSDERNNNYTADNSRIVDESGIVPQISIEDGIAMQIEWEKSNFDVNTKFDGE